MAWESDGNDGDESNARIVLGSLAQDPALLRRKDAQWRVARHFGIANMHKLSDLDNVGESGSAMRALASSLLANADTRNIAAGAPAQRPRVVGSWTRQRPVLRRQSMSWSLARPITTLNGPPPGVRWSGCPGTSTTSTSASQITSAVMIFCLSPRVGRVASTWRSLSWDRQFTDRESAERSLTFVGVEADAVVALERKHSVRVHDTTVSDEEFHACAIDEDADHETPGRGVDRGLRLATGGSRLV